MTKRAVGARVAAFGFSLAVLGIGLMLLLMIFQPGGAEAIGAIGGQYGGPGSQAIKQFAFRIALFCDTLLPIGYGCGFIGLALTAGTGFSARLLAVATIGLTVMGVGFDFMENALAAGYVLAGENLPSSPGLATIAKFGLLGAAAALLSFVLGSETGLQRLLQMAMRYIAPLLVAVLNSGFAGAFGGWLLVTSLAATFVLAAVVSHQMGRADDAV